MVPERWSGSWPDCLRLARLADEAGFEFMLPMGRWKGYGGDTDYQGETLETVTWAAGLLAATRRLTVFGTVHAPLIHPVIAAKQFVTADHIGEGRFGLNVVCGWNEDEFDHVRRHDARARGALRIRPGMARHDQAAPGPDERDFDVDGRFIQASSRSAPSRNRSAAERPIMMNAGGIAAGQAFAIRNCDALFSMRRGAGWTTSPHMSRR